MKTKTTVSHKSPSTVKGLITVTFCPNHWKDDSRCRQGIESVSYYDELMNSSIALITYLSI